MSAASRNNRTRHFTGRPRRRSGFTLLEAVVATALFIILFGLFFEFLLPCLRTYAVSEVRTEIQQEALRSIEKITSDFELAVTAGVSIYTAGSVPETGPVYLGMMQINADNPVSADPTTDSGDHVWAQSIVVYSWKGKGEPLIRKVWTPATPPTLSPSPALVSPTHFTESTLVQIANEPLLKGQILARKVVELRLVYKDEANEQKPPYEVTIHVDRDSPVGRVQPETFTCSRKISLRNQQ
jgi:hypothetical protein